MTPPNNQTVLSARDVDVVLGGRTIIAGMNVEFRPGEMTALVGPNGAGKSTLFSVLSGDQPATSGEVTLDGRDVRSYKAKELATRRAVLPQDHIVRFSYAVEEVVELARLAHTTSPDEDKVIINDALTAAEMVAFRRRDVQTLSGGEMARVAFARVLAQTTPVVFLDEPTAALDLRHQELVMGQARALRDAGATVIVVVHDLNLAAAYADRIVMMAAGRLVADGRPDDVLTSQRVSEVYRQAVIVTKHPTRGTCLVLPTDAA
ncbi:heme ABC transporter ATP-binding protein [Corynebacterium uterequi]|uniref:ABC-type hemin transport system, ATPase component n=1 Tax=Corynebacterium uterequi TaxID=1072256 RepID=A0A0G3HKP3_9CORY|nr:heme ABC transporter ATP-binding protein [Corynebacterium uterequi]AKK11667.1 ABC-type hemin transport system, ATPase component [Corynebacterium uterequi]